MRTATRIFASALVIALGAACGSTTSPGGGTSDGGTGSSSSAITTFHTLDANTLTAVDDYRTSMTAPGVTLASCQSIHDRYDAEVRPWIVQMVGMAGQMDDFIDNHGGAAVADVRCASSTMLDELDYHRSIACTLATLGADQSEAIRHANAMNTYGSQISARCVQMLTAANGGACCNWVRMMDGCEGWSTTCCSSMMHSSCCGGMTGGGGHMMHGGDCCGGS